MTSEDQWRPRYPDPSLKRPLAQGLRSHVHPTNRLHGWVFLQQRVWVDYWGNEHEIGSMPIDYVGNVIRFCEQGVRGVQTVVVIEVACAVGLRLAGIGQGPTPLELLIVSQVEQATSAPAALAWLHQLPLLQILDDRLEQSRVGRNCALQPVAGP